MKPTSKYRPWAILPSPVDVPRINRMIDNDISVSDNYHRLIMQTIDGIYDDAIPDDVTKGDLRERIIGQVRSSLLEVFEDLLLAGVGRVGSAGMAGTFYFDKGQSSRLLFKYLSVAGGRAGVVESCDRVIKRN